MRLRSLSFVGTLAFAVFYAGSAFAAGPRDKSNTQFSLHRDEQGDTSADTARARARAGDCKGAIPSFDAAINVSIDPTLRRDRGLCFEKLTDPFPAMEDFRAYLTARPNASDAEQIRQHLFTLESANSVEGSGPPQPATEDNAAATQGQSTTQYDNKMASEHLAQEAEYSALRKGTGLILGAYFGLRDIAVPQGSIGQANGAAGGTTSTLNTSLQGKLGYSVGGTLRASVTSNVALYGEIGYVAFGTTGDNDKAGGFGSQLGMELRVPFGASASDQFIAGVGVGYEHYTADATKIVLNMFPFLLRLGYRHVFGPSFGLELVGQGGAAYVSLADLPANTGTFNATFAAMFGGQLAMVVSF